MAYRLIALDLDGTLLTSKQRISPRTGTALRAARERGIIAVVATGRAVPSTRQWSNAIGGGPAISCNGAGILDSTGALMVARGLPQGPLIRLLTLSRESGLLAECYTESGIVLDRPWLQVESFWRWVRPYQSMSEAAAAVVRVWWRNRIRVVPGLLRWAERPERPVVLKLMLIGEPRRLRDLVNWVTAEMPGLEITSSGRDNLEVTAAGVSKGNALQQLAAHLRIPREAIVAVGDSANDLEMLRYAGLGVAMGNAIPEVRAAAARVTGSNDEDGVATLIEELCLT